MSAIDEIIEENMVCATVNAPHRATSATIQAYLAAHRPDSELAFKISAPSAEVAQLCEQVLGSAGVSLRRATDMQFVGTAAGRIWAKLLLEQGELLDTHSISFSPGRPGNLHRPRQQ